MDVLPANSGGGHALWSNISSVSAEQPYRAHLGAASGLMYSQFVLGTRSDSIGVDIGAPTWPRHFGGDTSVQTMSAAENIYPLPPAHAGDQRASTDPNGLLRISENSWERSKYPESLDFETYTIEYNKHKLAFSMHDDNVVDEIAVPQMETDLPHSEETSGRRPSVSTFSMSSTGLPAETLPHIEEPSTTLNASTQAAEYTATPSIDLSSSRLNPLHSPQIHNGQEHSRPGLRGRASSSPRRSVRAAPYSIDHERSNRWSTGAVTQDPARHGFMPIYPEAEGYSHFLGHLSVPPSPSRSYVGFPASPSNQQAYGPPVLASQPLTTFQGPSTLLPPPMSSHHRVQVEIPPPLPSHTFYQISQLAGESRVQQRYNDSQPPNPPDLYASLRNEEDSPPPEDMNTTDPDLIPHRQDLRFDGDLYTPRWVRGQGNKREGWCGICKPGRWLVLKNSAFWYDKSFSHGISAATGAPFEGPQANRRLEGNPDVWEGYCGSCHEWIALVSSKRKGTTWFRHAYKVCILFIHSFP